MTSTDRPIAGRRDLLAKRRVARSRSALAALGLLGAFVFSAPEAFAETRSLKIIQLHTGEKAEIVFKRNGRYDQAGLQKINYLLRDWRKNQPTTMNPRLLDLVWEAYRQSGATGYINVVCGYRSPGTNAMLKSRSRKSGVAEKSQHMLGNAMDFFIPGVKLKTLREIGLKMQGGGVGYYPTSGSPFVHFDVGNVRHWPKMSRSELVALFPNGKTLHVPSDGKPLPGFEQALAAYKARKGAGEVAIASATSGGAKKGFFSRLFGGGADEAEDDSSVQMAADDSAPPAAPAKAPAKTVVAAAKPAEAAPAAAKPLPGIQIVAPEDASPVARPAPDAAEAPDTVVAALLPRSGPLPVAAPRAEDAPAIAQAVDDTLAQAAAATPAELPARAPIELDAEIPQAIAANVPLPTWRPMDAPTTVAAAIADDRATVAEAKDSTSVPDAAVLTALAQAEGPRNKAAELLAPVPSVRPLPAPASTGVAALASVIAPNAAHPIPSASPVAEPVVVASAAPASTTLARSVDAQERAQAALALAKADAKRKQAGLAVLQAEEARADSADDKRLALASAFGALPSTKATGAAPVKPLPVALPVRTARAETGKGDRTLAATLFSDVKTTGKGARPSSRDTKPDAKPVPVAAAPAAARWAIYGERVASVSTATTAPSFAHAMVRSAPSEVYTAGFERVAAQTEPHRFTGKAVTFLGVARFETN